MSSVLTDVCPHPIVQAPMAGGVAVPQLAAAVSEAGGLGFLAAGYKTADGMYQEIKQLRGLTSRPFGVNLFLPQPETADPAAVDVYAHQLAGEASWYETALGDPDSGRDDGYDAKLAVLLDNPVPVVSFHFGVPAREVLDSLRRAGTLTLVTATTAEEARAVERAGADAVIAQGVEAGGHRGSFDDRRPGDLGLLALLQLCGAAVDLPLVATGGLATGRAVAAVLAAGARAAQLGSVFMRTPEAATSPAQRAALAGTAPTALTRAFTGRTARGIVNRFLVEHAGEAPAAYPDVHHLTAPVRAAARARGDADAINLWAGQAYPLGTEEPAGDVVRRLAAEARAALQEAAARTAATPGAGEVTV